MTSAVDEKTCSYEEKLCYELACFSPFNTYLCSAYVEHLVQRSKTHVHPAVRTLLNAVHVSTPNAVTYMEYVEIDIQSRTVMKKNK